MKDQTSPSLSKNKPSSTSNRNKYGFPLTEEPRKPVPRKKAEYKEVDYEKLNHEQEVERYWKPYKGAAF